MAAYPDYTLQMKIEESVSWLANYGSWHAYKKKKKNGRAIEYHYFARVNIENDC